jgi:hypothetical protein
MDHQKLVRLHGLATLVAEVGKHEAHMAILIKKLDGHGRVSPGNSRRKL